jgi:hypothetical protein
MEDPSMPLSPAYFQPRPLEDSLLADELESLKPIDAKVANVLGVSGLLMGRLTPQKFYFH